MKRILLLDLDMTLLNTSALQAMRDARAWSKISSSLHLVAAFEEEPHLVVARLRSSDVRIGVVTSSPSSYARGVLAHFGVTVDTLVGYHDTSRRKPHPDPIERALKNLEASETEAVYVGDEAKDVEASHAAGVVAVAALWGAANPTALLEAKPDVILENAGALVGFSSFTKAMDVIARAR